MSEGNKITAIASEIMLYTKNELCRALPPFIRAVNGIAFSPSENGLNYTDGSAFFFSAEDICRTYKKSKDSVTRLLLHSLLHCMFLHIWSTSFKNKKLWDLACDICVEKMINGLSAPCSETKKSATQNNIIEELSKNVKSFTAENLYYYFSDEKTDDALLETYEELFSVDNHNIWYKNGFYSAEEEEELITVEARSIYKKQDDRQGQYQENGKALTTTANSESNNDKERWKETSNRILRDFEMFPAQPGTSTGGALQLLKSVTREKFDYSDLLKRFLQDNEALEINDDEFDYIYYTYGLRLYDNIPLIEPLEYVENNKIRKLIIAIDTSGSVKGELVEGFIKKTYTILKETDFFKKECEIHILQCDTQIKSIAIIRNAKELENYVDNVTLHGFGGTDFTPVFNYADEMFDNLTNKKQFNGIIYFTDGDGKYPKKAPPYKNVFIIHDNGFDKKRLPVWTTPLYIDKNELRER